MATTMENIDDHSNKIDTWPNMPYGSDPYDGKDLFNLVKSGRSPFCGLRDVNELIKEVRKYVSDIPSTAEIFDIPNISRGASSYGIHFKLSDESHVIARLSRTDINMPNYEGRVAAIEYLVATHNLEVKTYELLDSEPEIQISHRLRTRAATQRLLPHIEGPKDIIGRGLILFKRAKDEYIESRWQSMTEEARAGVLAQAAKVRALLFNFKVPDDFKVPDATDFGWCRLLHVNLSQVNRLRAKWRRANGWRRVSGLSFVPGSQPLSISFAPTRDFCINLFTHKIKASIPDLGMSWKRGRKRTVGLKASAAREFLISFIHKMLPYKDDDRILYRLVLEHGDFGLNNLSIVPSENPVLTSIFGWECGRIWPAILSNPMMNVVVDSKVIGLTVACEDGEPTIQYNRGKSFLELDSARHWSKLYVDSLFEKDPDYKKVMIAGGNTRYLWDELHTCDTDREDPEVHFVKLKEWAEEKLQKGNRWNAAARAFEWPWLSPPVCNGSGSSVGIP